MGKTLDNENVVLRHHEAEKWEQARRLRRAMTLAETRLWERLRANQLGELHFRRQQVVWGFIVDFYCHAKRLVVEADGDVHDSQFDYDRERDQILTTHGLRVLRFPNAQILTQMPAVLAKIQQVAEEAQAPSNLQPPSPQSPPPAPGGGRGVGS